jgi:hypothetical protein
MGTLFQFHEAIGLEAQDAQALARTVQLRVLRWFARRGLLDPSTAADMRTWQGSGGFSVDGSVRIEGEDRAGLERLVRYCARGPLALERLHAPAGIGALSSPEARAGLPRAPRTRLSPTAHPNILRAPFPMAPHPPLPSAS